LGVGVEVEDDEVEVVDVDNAVEDVPEGDEDDEDDGTYGGGALPVESRAGKMRYTFAKSRMSRS